MFVIHDMHTYDAINAPYASSSLLLSLIHDPHGFRDFLICRHVDNQQVQDMLGKLVSRNDLELQG